MSVPLTPAASLAVSKTSIDPTYALCIDGISTCFTAVSIEKYIRFGDPDLFFGEDWVFGGVTPLEDQKTYVSLDGSSKRISQQLYPDKGSVSSVSSITVRLIDKNNEVSRIISPNVEIPEALGSRAELWIGFKGTAYPDDYSKVFAGIISDIVSGAGWVELTINHPDEKKRARTFEKFETKLNGAINNITTSITLDAVTGLIAPSDAVRSFIKIEDEFLEYTGISGLTLSGVVRGALVGTDPRAVAKAHDDNADVESLYILEGPAIDLGLKLMLSGSGQYATGVEIENFLLTETTQVPGAIYFKDVKLNRDFGLVPGDFITTTGASTPANNVTAAPILEIVDLEEGSYVVVGNAIALEADTVAVASFRSQYDTLPDGLGMDPRDVDVAQHEFIKETFLASINYRFYLKDTIEVTKDFIEQQIYVPFAGYALPRGTRSSLGLHVAPFPFSNIRTLSKDNVVNPSKLRLRRSYSKNFYNSIVYRFDEDLYEDKYLKGQVIINAQSVDELKRRKDLVITSSGMRTDLQAVSTALSSGGRLLDRYKRGAEFFENVEIFFSEGIRLEPGDAVIFDPDLMQITNTTDGSRNKTAKFFEVTNKDLDLSGKVTVSLTDTSFNGAQRYGLFSPASYVQSGTPTQITIKASFSAPFGSSEWRKWAEFVGANVSVRNADFSVRGVSKIVGISGNVLTLSPALSFTPLADYLLEFADYDELETSTVNDRVKLLYTFNSDGDNPFADGKDPYVYL